MKFDSEKIAEALRLRKLGYSWQDALNAAEIIVALSRSGFLALVPEDFEHAYRGIASCPDRVQ